MQKQDEYRTMHVDAPLNSSAIKKPRWSKTALELEWCSDERLEYNKGEPGLNPYCFIEACWTSHTLSTKGTSFRRLKWRRQTVTNHFGSPLERKFRYK